MCRWLQDWYSLAGLADKRRRGEPPRLYTHKDCYKLLLRKLEIQAQHSHIWEVVKEHTAAADGIPDCLPHRAYLGIADVLDPAGSRSSLTMLSSHFKASDAWMLQSPLVCTRNASRVLTIWSPKLGVSTGGGSRLAQRLHSLLLGSIPPKVGMHGHCHYSMACAARELCMAALHACAGWHHGHGLSTSSNPKQAPHTQWLALWRCVRHCGMPSRCQGLAPQTRQEEGPQQQQPPQPPRPHASQMCWTC